MIHFKFDHKLHQNAIHSEIACLIPASTSPVFWFVYFQKYLAFQLHLQYLKILIDRIRIHRISSVLLMHQYIQELNKL